MAAARDALRAAQAASAKSAGDYAAAQTLVAEEVARVSAARQARSQAISAASGLFMVRQLQTVVTRDPPSSLSLTADTPADLAPACLADHPGPPASLTPFLNLLLETPLAELDAPDRGLDWIARQFRPAAVKRVARGPPRQLRPFDRIGGGAAASDLANLAATTRSVIDPVLHGAEHRPRPPRPAGGFRRSLLPDLVTLPASTLRTNAETLRSRIESATGCLYQTLLGLPPSTRFGWATLAIAGTLPTLSFMQWPLPNGPAPATTTALRQLSTLVDWMAAQLDTAPAQPRRPRSAIPAAAVVASAYGDPNEVVSGTVASTGGVPRPARQSGSH